MADGVHIAQFDHVLGQQTQRLAGGTSRGFTARQHRQLRLDLAGELWLGARPALVVQRSVQSTGQKTPAHVDHLALAADGGIGNFLIRALLALTAIAQKQDTRSGVGTGRSVAGANQLLKLCSLFYGQFDVCMFAHAAQFSSMGQKCKI